MATRQNAGSIPLWDSASILGKTPVECPRGGCATSYLFTDTTGTKKEGVQATRRRRMYLLLSHYAGKHRSDRPIQPPKYKF